MLNFIKKLLGMPVADLQQIAADGAIILDVRSPGEFAGGHVKGAINVPVDKIGSKLAMLQKKNSPIIAYCQSGMRSRMAVSQLKGNGIEAYNAGSLSAARKLFN